MQADTTDDKLRDLFSAVRQEEAAAAPGFDRVTRAATQAVAAATPHSALWSRALAVAAAAAIGIGAALFWGRERSSAAEVQSWTALSNWQAQTDELLTVAGTPWGATVTTPTDTWLDNRASASETQENEERTVL